VSENEKLPDGTGNKTVFDAYVDTSLMNSRIEWPKRVVTVRNGDTGWATVNGQLDKRQQTPRMVPAINHKKLMPLLLPFTLQMDGITLGETAAESQLGHTPAYRFPIKMRALFFDTPFISDQWQVFFAREDSRFLSAGYLPVEKYIDVQPEGMQYRVLETQEIQGVTLPKVVQVEGLDKNGRTNRHGRTAQITAEVLNEPNPALFIHPEKLKALEEDE
jgi:hypothetical protein